MTSPHSDATHTAVRTYGMPVLWARTRSLWLLVPLHGPVDLIPQLAPFIRAWSGA